jgi:hypothetical protein
MLHRASDLVEFSGTTKAKGNEHGIYHNERKESMQDMFADTATRVIVKYFFYLLI